VTSRAQVAAHVAELLSTDREAALKAAAAWLVAKGRGRQAGYLARDIEQVLAAKGYVNASVTTARPMSDDARRNVETFIREATGARELELAAHVDPKIIGGALIETPDAQLDATVSTKLTTFVQGVSR
jgi:F0F1-type ATP synthase delta subunit